MSSLVSKTAKCIKKPKVWMHFKHFKDNRFPKQSIGSQVDECACPTSFHYDIKIYLPGRELA